MKVHIYILNSKRLQNKKASQSSYSEKRKAFHWITKVTLVNYFPNYLREQHNIIIITKKSPNFSELSFLQFLAVWTGLEPATFAVTGRHSNQLNYQTVALLRLQIYTPFFISQIFFSLFYRKLSSSKLLAFYHIGSEDVIEISINICLNIFNFVLGTF